MGEATALTWLDVEDNLVTIRRSAHRIEGQWVLTMPKSQAGQRTLAIPGTVEAALRAEKTRQAERRLRAGSNWQDRGLVFSNDKGGVLHPSMVAHALRQACDRLDLPHLTPHCLRHLSASLLLAQNIPLPNVSRRLGHANPAITARIYSHVVRADEQAAEALERLLKNHEDETLDGSM